MSIPAPLPHIKAFEQLGFGMFVHFGLYSKLNAGSEFVAISGEENKAVFDNLPRKVQSIKWMDNGADVPFKETDGKLLVESQNYEYGKSYCVRVAEVKFI